jgi:hypothetical protein
MKKTAKSHLIIALALIILPCAIFAQTKELTPRIYKYTIEDILKDPAGSQGKYVEIKGTVIQYYPVAPGRNTAYYVFQSDYGNSINVNSLTPPLNRKSYVVRGIVQLSLTDSSLVFLTENSRMQLAEKSQLVLILVLAICVLVIIGISIFLILQNRKNREAVAIVEPIVPAAPQAPASVPAAEAAAEFATIRLSKDSSPKTMRFIPGKLEIISGADKGKSFKIAGYQTPEGDVVTVGREKVTGERSFAHIEIGDQFKTVSRQHFKLVYRQPDLYVQNLSSTNPSRLNGEIMFEGESRKMESGSVISAGELEFQYNI